MTESDVEIVGRRPAYRGYFRVDSYRLRHRLFAGGWSRELGREVFERGHAAAVLLYDPERDSVVLVEQFRVGALAAGLEPWVLEVVAGIIEAGESAAEVARREAREEAGSTVLDLVPIHEFLVSPGCSSETVALFCARVDSRGIGGIHGLAAEGEDIRVSVVRADAVLAELASRRVKNAVAIIALQWLALNRAELRRRWGVAPNPASSAGS